MKATMTTLFVIAMLIASTQTFRHIYVKWIQSNSSVLDEFKDKSQTEAESRKTMKDLVSSYRKAKEDVTKYEESNKAKNISIYTKRNIEPYKTETNIRNEIIHREQDERQLLKLKFYWFVGLFSFVVGFITMIKLNGWLGFSGIVVGMSEMLVWTSPLFFNRSFNQQFVSLLDYKLTLSISTWLIIVISWLVIDKKEILKKIHSK